MNWLPSIFAFWISLPFDIVMLDSLNDLHVCDLLNFVKASSAWFKAIARWTWWFTWELVKVDSDFISAILRWFSLRFVVWIGSLIHIYIRPNFGLAAYSDLYFVLLVFRDLKVGVELIFLISLIFLNGVFAISNSFVFFAQKLEETDTSQIE